MEPIWPTHTSAVSTAMLALALAALAFHRRPRWRSAFALGALAGLVVHAHPTALLLGAALVVAAVLSPSSWRSRFAFAVVVAFVATWPYLPVWLSPLLPGGGAGPDNVIGLSAHLGSLPLASVMERLWPLLRGLAWGGAEMQWRVFIATDGASHAGPLAVHGAGLMLAGGGLLLLPREWRRVALTLVLLLLLQALFVLALRPVTQFWMSYAHGLLLSALVGLGGWSLWRVSRVARVALGAVLLVYGVGFLILMWRLAMPLEPTLAPVFAPGSVGMASITERVVGTRPVYPIRVAPGAWERLGAEVCEASVVYGQLAALLDTSFGLGARRACGSVEQITLGGQLGAGQRALIGLSAAASRAIGADVPTRADGLRLLPVTQVWGEGESLAIVEAGRYPQRDLAHYRAQKYAIEGQASGSAVLAVAARGVAHHPFELLSADANGATQAALYQDESLTLYRCAHCAMDASVRWRIELYAAPQLVDIAVFDPIDGSR